MYAVTTCTSVNHQTYQGDHTMARKAAPAPVKTIFSGSVTITMYLKLADLEALDAVAQSLGGNRSDALRHLLSLAGKKSTKNS